jgi:hypothetical protein
MNHKQTLDSYGVKLDSQEPYVRYNCPHNHNIVFKKLV